MKSSLTYCLVPLLLLLSGCRTTLPKDQMVISRIAYTIRIDKQPHNVVCGEAVPSSFELHTVSPLGTNPLQIKLEPPTSINSPTQELNIQLAIWSPNGRKLLVLADKTLYVINADGTGKNKIDEYSEFPNERYIAWSPDSQQLAYAEYDTIFIANSDGSHKIKAADSHLRRASNFLVGWSADSRDLLFYSKNGNLGELKLYRIPVPEKLPEGVENLPEPSRNLLATWPSSCQIQPNGKQICRLGTTQEFKGCRMHPDGRQVACLIGSTVKLITINSGKQENFLEGKLIALPVWSPDGQSIAFTTIPIPGKLEALWTMASNGLYPRHKIAEAQIFSIFQWSPDGQKLLYAPIGKDSHGHWTGRGLFTIDADGTNRQALISPDQAEVTTLSASWQP
jgi:WD40 repeat protein